LKKGKQTIKTDPKFINRPKPTI